MASQFDETRETLLYANRTKNIKVAPRPSPYSRVLFCSQGNDANARWHPLALPARRAALQVTEEMLDARRQTQSKLMTQTNYQKQVEKLTAELAHLKMTLAPRDRPPSLSR